MLPVTVLFPDTQDQYEVSVTSTDTILSLKNKLAECENYIYPEPEYINLIYDGDLVKDSDTLMDIGLSCGDTITAEISQRWISTKRLRDKGFAVTEEEFIRLIDSGSVENIADFAYTEVDKKNVMTLHRASESSVPAIFKIIVDTNVYDLDGLTVDGEPLIHIIFNEQCLQLLLEKGVSTAPTADGYTLLMSIVHSGDVSLCKYILDNTVSEHDLPEYINAKRKNGCTALSLAIECGHQDIVHFLREKNAVFDYECLRSLCECTSESNLEMFKTLLSKEFEQNEKGETILMMLCANRSEQSVNMIRHYVSLLLANSLSADNAFISSLNLPADTDPYNAIFTAASSTILVGQNPFHQPDPLTDYMLHKLHTNPTLLAEVQRRGSTGSTALNCACYNASFFAPDIVKFILSISKKELSIVNDSGVGPFLMAADSESNGAAILKILISACEEEGINIKELLEQCDNKHGYTPLGVSGLITSPQTSEILLAAGANPHVICGSTEKLSFLGTSIRLRDVPFLRRLIEDYKCKLLEEDFPLIQSMENPNEGVLEYILSVAQASGMDLKKLVNQKQEGITALTHSLWKFDVKSANLLIRHGAEPDKSFCESVSEADFSAEFLGKKYVEEIIYDLDNKFPGANLPTSAIRRALG